MEDIVYRLPVGEDGRYIADYSCCLKLREYQLVDGSKKLKVRSVAETVL